MIFGQVYLQGKMLGFYKKKSYKDNASKLIILNYLIMKLIINGSIIKIAFLFYIVGPSG